MSDRGIEKGKPTPRPWRAVCVKGVASVKGPDCAIYLNERTVETDECVSRWHADARLIVRAVNSHDGLVARLKARRGACPCEGEECARCQADDAALAAAAGR